MTGSIPRPRIDDAVLDRVSLLRRGRSGPRKVHNVRVCACGEQAFAQPTPTDTIMVDAPDQNLLHAFWWTIRANGASKYAESPTVQKYLGRSRSLHGVIAGHPLTDHADGNGLNNMGRNLRPATKSQNAANAKYRAGVSRFRGVTFSGARGGCWAARIRVDNKELWLGRYATEEEAASAYDRAALEHFGDYALLNFSAGRRAAR